jgi:hypothetical protein
MLAISYWYCEPQCVLVMLSGSVSKSHRLFVVARSLVTPVNITPVNTSISLVRIIDA